MTDTRPDLPVGEDRAGDEPTVLAEMLDYFRTVLLRKTHGLTAEQLGATLGPSELTLAGLLLHMAMVEDIWFHVRFAGLEQPEPWSSVDWDADHDWEFHTAPSWPHDELTAQYAASIARSNEALAASSGPDQIAAHESQDGKAINLRWIMAHMIEEYARHCGHADLLRESIDGSTGD